MHRVRQKSRNLSEEQKIFGTQLQHLTTSQLDYTVELNASHFKNITEEKLTSNFDFIRARIHSMEFLSPICLSTKILNFQKMKMHLM
jgi:hypothetical protein